MREIKFRAWDKHMNKMADKEYFQITFNGILIDGTPSTNQEDYVVMQYTGLKDKNGKEIYESDIVLGELSKEFYKGTVEFHWGCFKINFPHQNNKNYSTLLSIDNLCFDGKAKQIEVIGNIYENPKLMEESK